MISCSVKTIVLQCAKRRGLLLVIAVCLVAVPGAVSVGQEPSSKIAEIRAGGQGIASATEAARQLQSNKNLKLEDVLKMAATANPVAKNWYLAIAQTVAQRIGKGEATRVLSSYLADKTGDAHARYWALDYLSDGDQKKREAMLESMLNDPSLDIRYEAVELALRKIDESKSSGAGNEKLVQGYSAALDAARLPSQIQAIAKKLEELGSKTDLLKHFGFLHQWHLIAPFDNRNQAGFNVVYGPENEYLQRGGQIDLKTTHEGKTGKITWNENSTAEANGALDLNPIFKNEKGAVCYAYAQFEIPQDLSCDVRLGCINGNKVWVNGQLALSNEIYHASTQIDQYVGQVQLKKGLNTVLLKVCQNEQTESWAQDWKFQIRFTDSTGKTINWLPQLASK